MPSKEQKIVVSAFIPHNDTVLIVQRAANDDFLANYWELVGGKVEWGEHPFAALIREAEEEAGIQIKPVRPIYTDHYLQTNGRHLVEMTIICEKIADVKIRLSEEHQNYRWLAESEIPQQELMTDFMRQQIIEGFKVLKIK